ncbi:MAG: hypothetical protein QQN41_11650, partial [Nitrosopumilus sp.]
KKKQILINWDAHADLNIPFIKFLIPIKKLQNASTYKEMTRLACHMSISGWILPLFYQDLFKHDNELMEMIWIVPRESQESVNKGIVYGDFMFDVNYDAATNKYDFDNFREAPHPNTDAYQHEKNGKKKKVIIHIMDPDNIDNIIKKVDDAQILLSVDADYTGTKDFSREYIQDLPEQLRKIFSGQPHYPLNRNLKEEERHKQLIRRLGEFYERLKKQVKSVSIAKSPNFTADEERRKPVSKILKIFTGNDLDVQPEWVRQEINRTTMYDLQRMKYDLQKMHSVLLPSRSN